MAGKRIKKANKKSTKGAKNLWKKGQSSSYNPQFNKFRLEAKKRGVFGNPSGNSRLTQATLATHNKLTSSNEYDADDTESMSIGGDTAISAISGFTNCSLPTFNRLMTNWNAGSLLHKEMIAVVAAVTEVLKTHGGKETETEYFAALMTTLDVADTDEGITAVVCLLSMIVRRLNQNVLKHECNSSLDKFTKLLLKYMSSDHCALLRNLLKIVLVFLKVKETWSKSCCEKLKVVLEFTVHHKPKVRKAAHEIVRMLILDEYHGFGTVHPACAEITDFCISKLRKGGGVAASKNVFYVLSLLEETLGVFPMASIKSLSETILPVMLLSNSILTSACLRTLRGMFQMKPKAENLPSDLNVHIIRALYDFQPHVKEIRPLITWLQLMEAAFLNLKQLDEMSCVGNLPKFYEVALKCMENDDEEVLEILTAILKNLLYECIHPSGEVFQLYVFTDPVDNPMNKMCNCTKGYLAFKYFKSWKYILTVMSAFFEVMGKHCCSVMKKCVKELSDMHNMHNFPCLPELEKAIGMAIQHMGPESVLKVVPLEIKVDSDKPYFPRQWLLPLLRGYVKKSEIKFFADYFLPLAAEVKQKAVALGQQRKVESTLYDLICTQIWGLLPSFCNEATDVKENFKEIAQTLGKLLKSDPSLQINILNSLRMLINKNLENVENRMELSRFSKNYLPILFDLYIIEPKGKNEEAIRLMVHETIKAFLQITHKELCKKFFDTALEKLLEPDNSDFMRQCMIDICRALLPYVDFADIEKIYDYCKPLLKNSNHTTQKKSYSIFNEICKCESESCKLFVKKHLEDIRPILCGSVSGLTPATRALRLNILINIIKRLSIEEKDFIKSIVPEAVLCTKENSVKARSTAFDLLIVIGKTLLEWQPNDQKGAMYEYITLLLAGFAGSPHLMSASILSIGRVIFEFRDKMDSNLIHLLIENTCLLLTSKSREVVVSAMSFVKILFSVLTTEDLAQHVEFMVKSLTSISEDNQRHFRFKAKELFTRLIRKFGYEMIAKLAPESSLKQMRNIRKTEARKARMKNKDDDYDDDVPIDIRGSSHRFDVDSDEEMPLEMDTDMPSRMPRKKRKTIETIIDETGEDDIVNFLEPGVNQRLLTKNPPKIKKVEETESSFPLSKDGRLIIVDEDAENKETAEKSKRDEERKEMLADLAALKGKKRKRDNDDDGGEVANTTVPTGIYRTLNTKAKKKIPGAEFKAKKAGGDVKKGKFDPFAYIPLNKQMLNRRKQLKVKGEFKNFVKGAKKGAAAGAKRKMKVQARRKKNKK